jgi:hypothetical protein
MQIFEKAEIYVIALISGTIDTGVRVNKTAWKFLDYETFDAYFTVVDSLAVHSNLLGFMVDLTDYRSDRLVFLPRFKAYVRDIREHLTHRGYRTIPVGAYGFNHGKTKSVAQHMSCGGPQVAADFYGLTPSRSPGLRGMFWCANSSEAYDNLAEQYQDYPIPVIVTYGCDANISHTFQETQYIAKREIFSGGVTDDWFQDKLGPSDAGMMLQTGLDVFSQQYRSGRDQWDRYNSSGWLRCALKPDRNYQAYACPNGGLFTFKLGIAVPRHHSQRWLGFILWRPSW